MENNKDPKKIQLDNYLQEVKEKEKRKRKQRMLVLLFTLLVSVGAFGYYKWALSGDSNEVFRYADAERLTIYKVDSMFKENQQALIITNEFQNRVDTVRSVNEYLDIAIDLPTSSVPEIEKTSIDSSVVFDNEESFSEESVQINTPSTSTETPRQPQAQSATQNSLPEYFFDLAGRRVEGEKLTFTIENYDSDIVYIIDLGNGEKQRVGREWSFQFDKAGTYQLALIATNSSGARSQYTKKIVIGQAKIKTAEDNIVDKPVANPSLAENTNKQSLNAEKKPVENSIEPEIPMEERQPPKTEEKEVSGPLKFAEKMPSFPGGTAAMYKFLNKKLKYPSIARENEIEGKVYVQFVVQADGSIKDLQIVKGIGYGCDEEAIRVVGLMPKWVAGSHKGKKVPVFYTLAVNFRFR